jgi:nicotinamide mononucleotide adenylyltransferase
MATNQDISSQETFPTYDDNDAKRATTTLRRSATFPPPEAWGSRPNRIQNNEIARKLIDFSNKLQSISTEDIGLEIINNKGVHIFYFIGRFNPPHAGHIYALEQLIRAANAKGTVPLILLGNGPASERGKNPIDFDLKQRIIRQKLLELGINPDQYILKSMSTPFQDVPRHIAETVSNISEMDIDDIQEGYITHFVGDKGDDSTKLNSLLPIAQSTLARLLKKPIEIIHTETVALQPLQKEASSSSVQQEDMSATEVRNEAKKSIDNGTPFKYADYYGRFSDELLSQIRRVNEEEAAKGASKEEERLRKEAIKLAKDAAKMGKKSQASAKRDTSIMSQDTIVPIQNVDTSYESVVGKRSRSTRSSKSNLAEGIVEGGKNKKVKKTKKHRRNISKKIHKIKRTKRSRTTKKYNHKSKTN